MTILNYSKNCNITESSFLEDLVSYQIKNGSILWQDGTSTAYSTKTPSSFFQNDPEGSLSWEPHFFDSDSLVDNKAISENGSLLGDSPFNSGRLGIEDCFSFVPKFNNWTTTGTMTVDWILNRVAAPYSIYAGLAYWSKNNSLISGKIENFPAYSKLKLNNIEYIKLDNETLRRISPNRAQQNTFSRLGNTIFNYTDGDADIKIDSLKNNNQDPIFILSGSDTKDIWISDGEHLMYGSNRTEALSHAARGLGLRSYVSNCLYKYYNNIYTAITIEEPIANITGSRSIDDISDLLENNFTGRYTFQELNSPEIVNSLINISNISDSRDLRKLRLYKKLAHALSTSPFVSDFFVSFLSNPTSSVQNAINNYLSIRTSSIPQEILLLKETLMTISNEYSRYEIRDSNVIKNNDELMTKLISKYGAKLKLTGGDRVSYKNRLQHGDSLIIDEIGQCFSPKNLSNTDVSINKTISLNRLSVETVFSKRESSIALKRGDQTTNIVHLFDTIKPKINNSSTINIVLSKNNSMPPGFDYPEIPRIPEDDPNNNMFYTFGRFGESFFLTNEYWARIGSPTTRESYFDQNINRAPLLKIVNLDLEKKYNDVRFPRQSEKYMEGLFSFLWQKVSGPECKLIDADKRTSRKLSDNAYSDTVFMIPSKTGKYVIKCIVSSPFGSFTKYKTIFVVHGHPFGADGGRSVHFGKIFIGPDLVGDGEDDITDNPDNQMPDLWYGDISIPVTTEELGRASSENIPIRINRDNLNIFSAGLTSIAIDRRGLFAPIRSQYSIELVLANDRPILKLEKGRYVFKFDENKPVSPSLENSNISITYNCVNSLIKLDRIILANLRNNSEECSQCYGLYRPRIQRSVGPPRQVRRDPPRYYRTNTYPDVFTVQTYTRDEDTGFYRMGRMVDYEYPEISTDFAPPVKTYGGYGNAILDKLPINNIDSLERPARIRSNSGFVAESPNIIPPVTGYDFTQSSDFTTLDFASRGYKFCKEKAITPSSNYINFHKGTFIPSSGWVVGDNMNMGSVLKFNPGARKSFSFTGPGILNLSNYSNMDTISATLFKSSIELKIDESVVWHAQENYSVPTRELVRCGPPPEQEEARRSFLADEKASFFLANELGKKLRSFDWPIPDQPEANAPHGFHHGYRVLSGKSKRPEQSLVNNSPPNNDEFDFGIDETNNSYIYNFSIEGYRSSMALDPEAQEMANLYRNGVRSATTGPGRRLRDFIEERLGRGEASSTGEDGLGSLGIIIPRVNFLEIKDIEIKLNFLNYVNTKNLAIWIETDHAGSSAGDDMKRVVRQNRSSIIRRQITPGVSRVFKQIFASEGTHKWYDSYLDSGYEFPNTTDINLGNTELTHFVRQLTNLNSAQIFKKLRLFLLNQDNIQNKEYNFSVKFSDSANKYNTFFDYNLFGYGKTNGNQNVIKNNSTINPSLNAPGISSRKNYYYHKFIKNNDITIINNSFAKFADKSLFGEPEGRPRSSCAPAYGAPDGVTKFTLYIAVLDEEDEMLPLDNLETTNTELKTNIASVENKITSSNLFNNLCSWDLIIHTEETKKPVVSNVGSLSNYGGTDSLSLIEYGAAPRFASYSFIADLSNEKFLLPAANMNAPISFFNNYSPCDYAEEELIGKGVIIDKPRYPTEAGLIISASIAGAAFGGGGTIAGTLAGGLGPGYNQGFQMILDFFKDSRLAQAFEAVQRDIFDVDYESYPMGDSDKVLLNVSKDNLFWYKLEASIFKLSNTPALPLKEYKFLKPDENSKLSKFLFKIVEKNSEIIDEIFFAHLVPFGLDPYESEEDGDGEWLINRLSFSDILTANTFISMNKIMHSDKNGQMYPNIFHSKQNNNVLLMIDSSMPYYLIDINESIKILCNINTDEDERDNQENSSFRRFSVVSKALIYKDGKYQTVIAINLQHNTSSSGDCNENGLCPEGFECRDGKCFREHPLKNCSNEIILPDNIIIVYDNNSTIYSDRESPISLFGLVNDQPPNDSVPSFTFSTNSIGSYGDGTPVKDKNVLSRKVKINNIEPIDTILNSFINNRLYSNKRILTFTNLEGNSQTLSSSSLFSAYPSYYDQDYNKIIDYNNFALISTIKDKARIFSTEANFNNNSFIEGDILFEDEESIRIEGAGNFFDKTKIYRIEYIRIKDRFDNILSNIDSEDPAVPDIKDNWSYLKNKKHNIIYLKGELPEWPSGVVEGSITIENSYTYMYNVQGITQTELDTLLNRLNLLNVDNIPTLDSVVGRPASTAIILSSNSIEYIKRHYDSLEEDNLDCSGNSCNKKRTFSKLQKLYSERSEILKLINDQTIKYATVIKILPKRNDQDEEERTQSFGPEKIEFENDKSIKLLNNDVFDKKDLKSIQYLYILDPEKQKYRSDRGGILADTKIELIINNDGSISINYVNNTNNMYWINIDPKQSCSIAEELRPRVLKSIQYICSPVNPLQTTAGTPLIGGTSICFDINRGNLTSGAGITDESDVDFVVDKGTAGANIKYNIKENIINEKKQEYEKQGYTYGWREQRFTRYFRTYSNSNMNPAVGNPEYLVECIEVSDIALTRSEAFVSSRQTGQSYQEEGPEMVQAGITRDDGSYDASRNNPTRVYNIFNLDNVDNLLVQFRKIPRLQRGIDKAYTVLRYGELSSYRQQRAGDPIAPKDSFGTDTGGLPSTNSLNNIFYQWECFQKNPQTNQIEKAITPDIFSLLNEMTFRTFFGSVDGIEYKEGKLKSLYNFELIPFEYLPYNPTRLINNDNNDINDDDD